MPVECKGIHSVAATQDFDYICVRLLNFQMLDIQAVLENRLLLF